MNFPFILAYFADMPNAIFINKFGTANSILKKRGNQYDM